LSNKIEKSIVLTGVDLLNFSGINEENIDIIRNEFESKIVIRGELVSIRGEIEEVQLIEKLIKELIYLQNKQGKISRNDIELLIDLIKNDDEETNGFKKKYGVDSKEINDIIFYKKNDFVKPRTETQFEYYKQVQAYDIVFAIGPAGTGKTYLAVAFALAALKNKLVKKIVLTRPVVEAGENLGFLPGDISEKVDPYLKPLYDALEDMVPFEKLKTHLERNVIEIAPLAYMRGRTLNNSFVILDEAQNSTAMQMKMFLTRLGANSKAIITGDITQIDLPQRGSSGLIQVQSILKEIKEIAFVYFKKSDVVRHKLVKDIIDAYEKYGNNEKSSNNYNE
jgi:phosphate starvation-inducible PhoH-like protein